ncbi:zinc finger protein Noc [Euwallacea fornicatus]|uniref:zinc finger protein Noc n=1 Tax=Euwallacea fornicatus TaxID=995702 RepID=UPI00339065C8
MVVLEGAGLLSAPGNQYLQPDYLSPLSTTLDAKKSPLALLAQTCSQIGADSPNSKPLLSSLDKKKAESRSSPRDKNEKISQRSTPSDNKLAFKPYETTVVSRKVDESRPSSQKSVENEKKSPSVGVDRKSVSPTDSTNNNNNSESGTPGPDSKGKLSPESQVRQTTPSASPIIRPGLEILQGHSKDSPLGAYKPLSTSLPGTLGSHLSSLCCPPGLEHAASNPAFRPPFPGAPYSHHHSMMGYPGASPGPYLSYARVKTPSGGEALVPVCKDPYCTGCQFSLQNQQLLMSGATAGPCPSGCTQCDHQKYNLAMAMSLGPPSSLAYPSLGRPYVCNWIAGDAYCGKRFVTSEELLQHLRTHTSASADAATSSAASLLNHSALLSSAALHRSGYPSAPLSPLSAARYHPYAKPGLPASLAASPYSAFNPASLGPYYSPYALYGQRLGSAAVHP